MKRTIPYLGILVLAVLLWGCARGPDPLVQKNKDLEVKISKMQADMSDLTSRFADLDQRFSKEQDRLKQIETERDLFARSLKARTDERDNASTQIDTIVKNLEQMLTQAKAAKIALQQQMNTLPAESTATGPSGAAFNSKLPNY